MQNLGNRRSVQKCAQKTGSYVLKNDITDRPTLFIFKGKRSIRDRIEIKYLFSWLLLYNLLGVELLFQIQKPHLLYFKQHFSISEVIPKHPQKRFLFISIIRIFFGVCVCVCVLFCVLLSVSLCIYVYIFTFRLQ